MASLVLRYLYTRTLSQLGIRIVIQDSVLWLLYSYVSIRPCKNICSCGLINGFDMQLEFSKATHDKFSKFVFYTVCKTFGTGSPNGI